MVYDKYQISLFEKGSSLPKMLVEIDKRADEIFLVSKQQKAENGLLFLHYQNKYFMMEIGSAFCEFAMKNVEFSKSVAAAFFGDTSLYVGGGAMTEEILQKFRARREAFLKEKAMQALFESDPNFVADKIMEKMFEKTSLGFFEHTKAQLFSLFSCSNRAKELEKIIPSSKFIETYSEGAKAYAGIVYKKGLPFAIGIGYSFDGASKLYNQSSYQYFYNNDKKSGGYFLSFRRASDGDRVDIN